MAEPENKPPSIDQPLVVRSTFGIVIDQFIAQYRRRMIEGVRAGMSLPELERQFAAMLRELNMAPQFRTALYDQLRREQRRTMEELRLEFVESRTIADRTSIQKLVAATLEGFSRYERNVEARLLQTIQQGIATGEKTVKLVERIESQTGIEGHRARTLARTGLAGVNRAAHIETALGAGVEEFRYMGGTPQRRFCVEHYRKVYTMAEIRAMDNGQGLDVWSHCGGYNCTHRWRAWLRTPGTN